MKTQQFVIKVLITTLLFSTVAPLSAINYYVSSISGNDANNGISEATAWKSINKVNLMTFSPGDKILFKAGEEFIGLLSPKGSGSAIAPIIIDTYGTGAPALLNGNGAIGSVIFLKNQDYWELKNLEIINSDPVIDKRIGVQILADDGQVHQHIHMLNLNIHDITGLLTFEIWGKNTGGIHIRIAGSSLNTGFNDILIQDCEIYNIQRVGIASYSSVSNAFTQHGNFPITNFRIRRNTIHHCAGDGIIVRVADAPLVEHNVLYENHNGSEALVDHGVSIWMRSTDNAVVQYNEVYNTRGSLDGQAFDADFEAWNSIFQYNYSHDNEGGFMLFMNGTIGTIVRYNISQNDGAVAGHVFYFSEWDLGGNPIRGAASIYNNTIFIGTGLTVILSDKAMANTNYSNNIVYNKGNFTTQSASSSQVATWNNNLFFGTTNYPSDPNLRTADPKLENPGSAGLGIESTTGYRLLITSPANKTGVVMSNNGGKDFFRNAVSSSLKPSIGCYNGLPINPSLVASFVANKKVACSSEKITYTNTSTGTITQWKWYFGNDALPATATGIGPHTIRYIKPGPKSIALMVRDANSMDSVCIENAVILVGNDSNSVCLYPTHDAYVRGGTFSTSTLGSSDPLNLITKNANGNDEYTRFSFLQYNVSSYSTVENAGLAMYLTNGEPAVVQLNRIASNTVWNENTLTWTNQPSSLGAINQLYVTQTNQYHSFDMQAYMQSNAGNSFANIEVENINNTILESRWSSAENTFPPILYFNLPLALEAENDNSVKEEISEFQSEKNIHIYPNPCSQFVVIDTKEAVDITIYNSLGQPIYSGFSKGRIELDIKEWNSGMYWIYTSSPSLGKFQVR